MRAVLSPHHELNAVLAPSLHHGGGDNVIGVLVLRQIHVLAPVQLVHLGIDGLAERGRCAGDDALVVARDEARPHNHAVLVLDVAAAQDVAHAHACLRAGKKRQRRREQEEWDAARKVELANLGKHRERRVVEHDHAVGVIKALVIPAGIKRTHHFRRVDAVLGARPVLDDLVHLRRRVAIVGGLLRLELLDEALVVLEQLALLRGRRASSHQ